MFTRRGFAVICFGVFLWVTGRVLGAQEFYILGTASILTATVAFLYVNVRRFDLSIARVSVPHKAHVNEQATIYLRLFNPGRVPTPPLVVRDSVGKWGEARHLAAPISPKTRTEVHYRLPTMNRGRMELGPTELAAIDPLGLAVKVRFVERTTSLLVLPEIRPLVAPPIPAQNSTSMVPRNRSSSSSDEFSLRDYREGDDARTIHWHSTARKGSLMVKEPLSQTSAGCTILLDRNVQDGSVFEEMVSMAASLLVSAAQSNMPFQLLTSDGLTSRLSQDESSLSSLIDYLAEVGTTTDASPNLENLRQSASAVVLTTPTSQLTHLLTAQLARMKRESSRIVVYFGTAPAINIPKTSVVSVRESERYQDVWNKLIGRAAFAGRRR